MTALGQDCRRGRGCCSSGFRGFGADRFDLYDHDLPNPFLYHRNRHRASVPRLRAGFCFGWACGYGWRIDRCGMAGEPVRHFGLRLWRL